MSKSKQSGGALGRALIKNKNKHTRVGKGEDSWLHSSELDDGYNWGRLNLRSVTEESKLDEFLSTAELAGTEFTAEKLNIRVIDPDSYSGLPSESEKLAIEQAQLENQQYLSIPRRPHWNSDTTPEQLEVLERDNFLEWRRNLAKVEENEKLVMTPFERNLEFWRQLWRVIERSDIVVQIVDARNPLLFRCEDLEKYVKELSERKVNMILISKADLLTQEQRVAWAKYFEGQSSITVAFWSALTEKERLETEELESHSHSGTKSESDSETAMDHDDATTSKPQTEDSLDIDINSSKQTVSESKVNEIDRLIPDTNHDHLIADTDPIDTTDTIKSYQSSSPNPNLLTREELIDLLLAISPVADDELTTVGMVGYPNVGKSSTINTLLQGKKVPVSATPGRTKHFQTLYLTDHLLLCDCPGLVFPTFVSTKAEMVCSGILPIDQLRDHIPPVSLVCERIPRLLLESTYGIRLPPPSEGEDQDRFPYAHELLTSYGYMRGFMSRHGRPDLARSARYILKDYVNGKLLYCHPPPGVHAGVFNVFPWKQLPRDEELKQPISSDITVPAVGRSEFDRQYFQQSGVRAITKGIGRKDVVQSSTGSQYQESVPESDTASSSGGDVMRGKPWKKHHNRHKKEKTRRTHKPLTT